MIDLDYNSVPELHEVKNPIVELALQFVRLVSASPQTAQNASLFTLLFSHLQEPKQLSLLGEWLRAEAEAFVNQSPRDQPNQLGKVLIAAGCIFTKDKRFPHFDHRQGTYDYINYAAGQNWFEEPFLAFYCHYLVNEVPVCESAIEFFQQNHVRFIERRNISAVVQSLLVLGDKINDVEKGRCYQLFKECWQTSSPHDLAWILMGSSLSSDLNMMDVSWRIAKKIMEHLNDQVMTFAGKSLAIDALTLTGENISPTDIEQYKQRLPFSIELQKHNAELLIRLPISESISSIDLFTFLLVLLALSKTGWSEFTGVYKAQKSDLISIMKTARVLQGKGIVVTPWEMFIANILTIIATFVIGFAVFGFFMNAEMKLPSINFSQSDWRNIDVLGGSVGLGFVVLLITELRAFVTGKSAISYWLEITPFKQFIGLINDVIERLRNHL
ncbi:MAG: hypothetical protein KA338_16660 [Chloroflexi bacterium]|nr:hypothetical protein [Chloroflexota bacterium]